MKLSKIVLSIWIIVSAGLYGQEEVVDINLRDVNLEDFIEMVSEITERNILIEGNIKGKINFISYKPIKVSAFFSLANSILGSKGLTIIDKGDYYKVLKIKDAPSEGLAVSSRISGDTMKTVMFPLKNINAAVIRSKIKPLLHKNDVIISFKENNILAITAKPSTLKSISKLINALESSENKKSTTIKLKHAIAKNIFQNIQNMSKKIFPQNIQREKVDIFKDEAINSIILIGNRKNTARMIKYIRKLDKKGESLVQKMYVIPLKNSNVEDMEKILSKLVSQMNNLSSKKAVKGGIKPSKAMVVSDIERNALVLLATAEQMRDIRKTINEIDIPKTQVYVKAKIVEVNNNMTEQIGLKYGINGGTITSNGLFSMGANLGASALQISPTLMQFLNSESTLIDGNGNAVTTSERPFTFGSGIDTLFSLGAQLDLLQKNGAAQILSEPSILCTNNKEASIYVGKTMSILTEAKQSTQGGSNVVNNYSREDIGITLKVKPRISKNNQVTLEVEAQIEDVEPGSSSTADRPTTLKRKVTTNAIVSNGETIILGGLIKKVSGKGQSKVPFFGDIPFFGEKFFTHDSDTERESNVVIYLTPYIVRRSSDLRRLRKVLNELDSVQKKYNAIVYKNLEKKANDIEEYAPPVSSRRIRRGSYGTRSNLSILDVE